MAKIVSGIGPYAQAASGMLAIGSTFLPASITTLLISLAAIIGIANLADGLRRVGVKQLDM